MTANAPTNDGYWTDAGNYATSFAGGSGTSSDPYLISTPQQLARLAYLVNTRTTNSEYSKLYYEQIANLDMSKYYWMPIGGASILYSFSGCYNGNNYSISHIYASKDTNQNYYGFFGQIEIQSDSPTNIEIKNINIIDSVVEGDGRYVGGIIAYLDPYFSSSFVSVENCSFSGEVNSTDVSSTHPPSSGGIIGNISFSYRATEMEIKNCSNYGLITAADGYSGGIIGCIYSNVGDYKADVNVYNCQNYGEINGGSGIVGDNSYDIVYIYIENCFNLGNITGGSGIFGQGCAKINNCFNKGNIVDGRGGIANSATMITNCYNTGNVTYNGQHVGGIVGICGGSNPFGDVIVIQNCYNTGAIGNEISSYVGGIVGWLQTDSSFRSEISNCYNMGAVIGERNVAGIAGLTTNIGRIYSCFNGGNVSGEENVYALCIGEASVSYSYWGGDCTASRAKPGAGSSNVINLRTNLYEYAKSEDWYLDTSNWIHPSWGEEYLWDFENTWGIDPSMNDGYPILMPTLEIMQFTITYHPNGASGDEVVESKVGSESYTIRSNMFTRSGYNFTGWNTEANGGGVSYSAGSSYSDLANLDLYAQWSRITYTIKYDKNASDATGTMANTTKYYGTNVTLRWNGFSRTGYSFAGWATSSGGAVVYANGTTYKANANVTLYAKWTAHKYTVKFNGNGSTSGSMKEQTFTYGTAQKLTSNAFKKTGFTFDKWTRNADGTGTSYTNGQSVKNLTSTNGAEIKLYAQWKANNEAKYDSAGGYWYIENGKIPQTKVTNSTLISNLNKATTNGGNYYIAGEPLTAKVYNDTEYCKWNNNWYEVEPIKWRLDASSSQKDGYGTTTDTNAVLAEIVYVDQYSSTSIDAGEGYSSQSVTDFMRNGISTTYLVNYTTSTQVFGNGTSLYGTSVNKTANMFVSSQSEITAVNGNLNITFSDLVEDIIKSYGGTNSYFTRDLGSNYNNITCINAVGKETQCFATNFRGLQFTVRFTEYGCVN